MRLIAILLISMMSLVAAPKRKTAVRSSPMRATHVKTKKKHMGGRLTPKKHKAVNARHR